jgi:hypothetical protein
MPNTADLHRTYKGGVTGYLPAMPDPGSVDEHQEFHDHMCEHHWEAFSAPIGSLDYGEGPLEFRNCPLCKTTLAKLVVPLKSS